PSLHAAELPGPDTLTREGAVRGALVGLPVGALVFGLIVHPLAAAAVPLAAFAFAGAVLCGVFGGLAGGIAAASCPDPALADMAARLRAGQVVLTVEATGLGAAERAEELVRRRGGRIARKPVV